MGHLLKELSELLAEKKGTARVFLLDSVKLFRKAIALKERKGEMAPASYLAQAKLLEKRLNGMLLRQLVDPDNTRLANRFRKQRPHLLRFLYHDDVDRPIAESNAPSDPP